MDSKPHGSGPGSPRLAPSRLGGHRSRPRVICRHCHARYVCRPRGLCWTCYYTLGVKDRYPSTSKFGRRGWGLETGENMPRLPGKPTAHLPGTVLKMVVMTERAQLGQELFNVRDAVR